jgi:ribonuclease HI
MNIDGKVHQNIMSTKYYAVVSGVQPGIYTNWSVTESMVKGFPGAIFKSFRTRADAETFMQQSTAMTTGTKMPDAHHTLPLIDKTIIYTDGSFKDGICGFGVVIITTSGSKIIAYGRVPNFVTVPAPTNNIAELYAIYVALSLVKTDVILYTDSRYSILCLTSYIHNWIKNGWSGIANRNLIEGAYQQMLGRTVDMIHVYGHSGIELNEEADRLADQGRIGIENLIIFKDGTQLQM